MDAVTQVPAPVNEPVHSYAPGSAERGTVPHHSPRGMDRDATIRVP